MTCGSAVASVRPGDLVRHAAGGPVMLVSMTSQDLAYCLWFADAARPRSGTFMTSRLVNVDRERRHWDDLPGDA